MEQLLRVYQLQVIQSGSRYCSQLYKDLLPQSSVVVNQYISCMTGLLGNGVVAVRCHHMGCHGTSTGGVLQSCYLKGRCCGAHNAKQFTSLNENGPKMTLVKL